MAAADPTQARPHAGPPSGIRSATRRLVHHPKLLDTIFGLAVALLMSRFFGDFSGQMSTTYVALGVVTVVASIGTWVLWRRRRAKGAASSRLIAIVFTLVSIGAYLLSNSLSSLALQWVATLVLTIELGVLASVAYVAIIATATVTIHVMIGTGLAQGAFEAIGVTLLLAVGVEFAVLLRNAERLDADRLAALDAAERSNAELARANDRLADANAELELANTQLRLERGREQDLALAEERARIATALHDGLGHRLTAIGMSLDFSDRMRGADPERAAAEARVARATATDALDEMRRVVRAMHPVTTDADDVAGSLAALAESFASTGLEVEFRRDGSVPIGREQGLLLLRVAQEGLTNVVRHAGASRAELCLELGDRVVRLCVLDDGRGAEAAAAVTVPPAGPASGAAEQRVAAPSATANGPDAPVGIAIGFGLRSMGERAHLHGGRVELAVGEGLARSDGGAGVALRLELPAAADGASDGTADEEANGDAGGDAGVEAGDEDANATGASVFSGASGRSGRASAQAIGAEGRAA